MILRENTKEGHFLTPEGPVKSFYEFNGTTALPLSYWDFLLSKKNRM